MKYRLMDIICCPYCKGNFSLEIFEKRYEEIVEGILVCNCGKVFPIIHYIPRIVLNALKDNRIFIDKHYGDIKHYLENNDRDFYCAVKEQKNRESFEFEWLQYNVDMGNEKRIFLEETQISADIWNNRLVLDAGCGMGRYTKIPVQLGAEVIGIDLGLSVEKAFETLRSFPHCHIIQADLMFPPFKKETFDIVYSLGVLHHTPDTKTAFSKIASLVKENGLVSIWVYGKAGRYKNFITNPLRADRKRFRKFCSTPPLARFFWWAVRTREILSIFLRLFTTRMSFKLLYYLCHILSLVGKIPFIKYITFSVLPNWKARVWENFDWLSPQFQHHHTKEEILSWFREEGFSELKILPHGLIPKPGVRGKKERYHTT